MTKAELTQALKDAGSEESAVEAKMILSELFGVSAAAQLMDADRDYDQKKLEEIVSRRREREPLAYILGYAYFCDEKYYLTRDTLVPRADTEMLVEVAVRELKYKGRFADLCTGSGCVAISTLARRPDLSGIAVDISCGACETAKKNASENGAADKLEITCADVKTLTLKDKYDAVISNPPYIKTSVIDTLSPEVKHEPRIALDGGEDGMDFYLLILDRYRDALSEDGFFAFEIGYDQGDCITRAAEERNMSCEVIRDYSGNARVALIRKRKDADGSLT